MTRHPGNENWPLQTMSTVTFEQVGGKTKVTVQWSPHEASDAERKSFEDGKASMQQGWSGTFEQFADYLKRTKA